MEMCLQLGMNAGVTVQKSERAKIKLYCDILSPLKDSTILLSASNTPTIHHLFSEMYDLLIHIESCISLSQAMTTVDRGI